MIYRLILLFGLIFASIFGVQAAENETIVSPPSVKVSVLTCGPSDVEPFLLYGHSAVRVQHADQDWVYNYGLFSFDQPHFLYNFAMGQPLYCVGAVPFDQFIYEYTVHGRSIVEQSLNISTDEALAIEEYLQWNIQPQNRDYLYSFFYDNCATRVRDLIHRCVGHIDAPNLGEMPTFREAIDELTPSAPWYTLGCNLALGLETDRALTAETATFLPHYLEKYLDKAVHPKSGEPLVSARVELAPQTHPIASAPSAWQAPHVMMLFVLILFIYSQRYASGWLHQVLRSLIFTIIGIGGIVLWFLVFASHHPHTTLNFNALVLTPLYLLLAVTIWFTRCRRFNNWVYFINFVAIIVGIFGGILLQTLPTMVYLLAMLIVSDHIRQYIRYKTSK